MTTKKIDPTGAQPSDPPWWRLVFLLVQGKEGQWWRGFLLFTLVGILLIGVLGALLLAAGWAGGAVGVGSLLAALGLARRSQRRSEGRQRLGGSAADATDFEADLA